MKMRVLVSGVVFFSSNCRTGDMETLGASSI